MGPEQRCSALAAQENSSRGSKCQRPRPPPRPAPRLPCHPVLKHQSPTGSPGGRSRWGREGRGLLVVCGSISEGEGVPGVGLETISKGKWHTGGRGARGFGKTTREAGRAGPDAEVREEGAGPKHACGQREGPGETRLLNTHPEPGVLTAPRGAPPPRPCPVYTQAVHAADSGQGLALWPFSGPEGTPAAPVTRLVPCGGQTPGLP